MRLTSSEKNELEQMMRSCANILLDHWPGNPARSQDFSSQAKSDGSLVTSADLASNKVIIDVLGRMFPEDQVISEEVSESVDLATAGRVWIIDPLDGTKVFAEGQDQFSILVALCEDHRPIFSMMLFPVRNDFVLAERGQGAFRNGKQLRVSASEKLRPNSVHFRNLDPPNAPCVDPTPRDSGAAFFDLCSGVLDGVVLRMTTHKEWDLAAPALVVEESGGRVSDDSDQELRFALGETPFNTLVGSNRTTHSELLSLIR